eukprot:5071248-Alexandrium_andersonii.AAC.1
MRGKLLPGPGYTRNNNNSTCKTCSTVHQNSAPLLRVAPKALRGTRCPEWPGPFVYGPVNQMHHSHACDSRAHARAAALGAEAPWII